MAENFPVEAIPVNGWVMEMPGMSSPHIEKVGGLGGAKTGTTKVVDGGTNRTFNFSDGILEHTPLTLERTRDGTADDKAFSQFFRDVVATGRKIDVTFLQFRHSKPVYKAKVFGLLLNETSKTDFDTEGTEKSKMMYTGQVDFVEEFYNEEAG